MDHLPKRTKLIAGGVFVGLMLVWLGIMIVGALEDDHGHPALERALKK
jgi:hypothetical protein